MTYDIRVLLFKSLIHKEVSWFDRKERAPGILTNILSEDITNLNGLTTETIGTVVESLFSLLGGIAAAAYYEWRMALVCLALTPFTVMGAALMAKLNFRSNSGVKTGSNHGKKEMDPYEKSNALLSDVILNYRTIISFG